jgi:hypothetical protein
MKQILLYTLIIAGGLLLILSSCQKEDQELGDLVAPTNVTITYEIQGADAQNPNGDGSGIVHFTATASNAITFNFDFGDGKDNAIAADGKATHVFSINGVNAYNVTVHAVGTGGISSSKSTQLEVFSSFSDDEALAFLTGGSTKSWYWAADQAGHLGLGPNDQVYDNGEHTFPAWYQAAPWEKSGSSMYDCEFKFSIESGSLTFEQINPTGEAFIQGIYSESLGLGPEGSYPWPIDGVKNVSFGPSSSIATIDGQYRGTSFNISDEGFMGFYAGTSEYEIIEVSENLLRVRMVQANEPLFAWYHIFVTEKPEQK